MEQCVGSPPILDQLQVLQGYTELALLRLGRELAPDHPSLRHLRQVLAACAALHALVQPLLPAAR